MSTRNMLLTLIVAVVLGSGGCAQLERPPVTAAPAAPDKSSFDPARVTKGAQLAAIGNCAACHTRAGGKPYAGGLALATPFGTIHSTNITPEPDTGIGRWTSADFLRAMHEGVGRDGRQLYPAFPYDHYTKVSDDDVNAIYAFIMTREPVRAEAPPNKLLFPANFRPAIASWKALYFEQGVHKPDPNRSPEWNRGAYLVEGLGHCGSCHTPRNALGAENKREYLAGGEAERWHAPAMNSASTAPVPWSADQLFDYLRHGWDEQHGLAAGPMAPIVHDLSQVAEEDVRAIAVYVASLMPPRPDAQARSDVATSVAERDEDRAPLREAPREATVERSSPASSAEEGAVIYAGACSGCHNPRLSPLVRKPVRLSLASSVNAPDARNVIHVVVEGIWPEAGGKGALMPGFAAELTEEQIIALVNYVRGRFSKLPAWSDVPARVREISRAKENEP